MDYQKKLKHDIERSTNLNLNCGRGPFNCFLVILFKNDEQLFRLKRQIFIKTVKRVISCVCLERTGRHLAVTKWKTNSNRTVHDYANYKGAHLAASAELRHGRWFPWFRSLPKVVRFQILNCLSFTSPCLILRQPSTFILPVWLAIVGSSMETGNTVK